jgi:hypothetical protein
MKGVGKEREMEREQKREGSREGGRGEKDKN